MTHADAATRLCLVRHGETVWNVERRLQGHLDVELNETGRGQAAATARALGKLSFAAVYASDLRRAHATAKLITRVSDQRPVSETGLRERHYGHLQGLTYSEAEARFPDDYARFLARDSGFAPSGGESLVEFAGRVVTTLIRIVRAHPGDQVLIVTHGGVLDVVHRLATGMSLEPPRDFAIPNAALNWIEWEDEQWRLLEWADRRHLDTALDEFTNG